MGTKASDQMTDLSRRVGALESKGFDENASVAKITKIYGGLKFSMTVTARVHTYKKCSTTLLCGPSQII